MQKRCRDRGCRGLGDHIARLAGVFGSDMPDALEAAGHLVQHLGDVLTGLRHAGTAGGADACAIGFGLVDDLMARQMIRQRPAGWRV